MNNIFNHTYYTDKKLNEDTIEKQKKKLDKVEYPCKSFWKIATQYDIKVLYGMDVHHRGQILRWNELVELAKEVIGKKIIEKLNFVENQISQKRNNEGERKNGNTNFRNQKI